MAKQHVEQYLIKAVMSYFFNPLRITHHALRLGQQILTKINFAYKKFSALLKIRPPLSLFKSLYRVSQHRPRHCLVMFF